MFKYLKLIGELENIFIRIWFMFKSNRDYKLYIEDIASECKNIKLFVKDTTYDEFTENLEKVYVVRCFKAY
jgi:hypothetical protein